MDGLEPSILTMVLWSGQGLCPRTWCFLLWAVVDALQEPQAKRFPLPPGTIQSLSHHPSSFKEKGKTWTEICSNLHISSLHSPVLPAYPFTDARIRKLLKNPRKLQANSGTQEPLSLNEMLLMIAGTQQSVGEGDLGEQRDSSAVTFAAHGRPKPTGGQ